MSSEHDYENHSPVDRADYLARRAARIIDEAETWQKRGCLEIARMRRRDAQRDLLLAADLLGWNRGHVDGLRKALAIPREEERGDQGGEESGEFELAEVGS